MFIDVFCIVCCRQKGGRALEAGAHYSTTQTQRSAQLVIHDATARDTGTYTAVVTRRDGTQVGHHGS